MYPALVLAVVVLIDIVLSLSKMYTIINSCFELFEDLFDRFVVYPFAGNLLYCLSLIIMRGEKHLV